MVNWPLRRIILSAFANRYIRAVTGLDIHDCTSGFRCWRREALAKVPLDRVVSDGYSFLTETIYEAHVRGARIGEVPIVFVERRMGIVETVWRGAARVGADAMAAASALSVLAAMTARQRVVMVATSYPRFAGDTVGTFMEPIATGLASRGHEVHLVLPWHPRWQRGDSDGGVQVPSFQVRARAGR